MHTVQSLQECPSCLQGSSEVSFVEGNWRGRRLSPRHDHRRLPIVAGVESRETHDAVPLFRRGNPMCLTPRPGNLPQGGITIPVPRLRNTIRLNPVLKTSERSSTTY